MDDNAYVLYDQDAKKSVMIGTLEEVRDMKEVIEGVLEGWQIIPRLWIVPKEVMFL